MNRYYGYYEYYDAVRINHFHSFYLKKPEIKEIHRKTHSDRKRSNLLRKGHTNGAKVII